MPYFRNIVKNIVTTFLGLPTGGANFSAWTDNQYLPASTAFLDMSGYDRVAFWVGLGGIADALTFAIYADTSATVTGNVAAVTGATKTIAATDDGKWVCIECAAANIGALNTSSLTYRYVTLKVSGVSGNNYGVVVAQQWRGGPVDLAVSQSASLMSVVVGG